MYKNIREEELKNKVAQDWFKTFDTTVILGNIDFAVYPKQQHLQGKMPLLWAEAKAGDYDLTTMFTQLILTIGRARSFDRSLPPAFLGAFDFKKMAFISYLSIEDIFYINDFNWNVSASDHKSKEFSLLKERIEDTLKSKAYVFDYQADKEKLEFFIINNLAASTERSKIKIDKNNFIPIYLRWLNVVKPIIDVDWSHLRQSGILDSDFYLADLFVDDKDTNIITDDTSIRDNLFVVFHASGYTIAKENIKHIFDARINIRHQNIYQNFWKLYKRPPLKDYQDYIIARRDLLVPQDIRERKGAFFTPRQWVELSQQYIADVLGDDWQDEYYIWDCAAGTGNLLAGLTNKYNIWASTIDQADVNVMQERIEHGANLLKSHVFQFDFLNDDFTQLPQGLQDIINDPEKRKKLVVYINPPYAEGDNVRGLGRKNVHLSLTHQRYKNILGKASSELFAQFLARIYFEIPQAVITNFSKLKSLLAPNFKSFRSFFGAELKKLFLVPANTFDNVNGDFPIAFFIWNTAKKEVFQEITADIYDKNGNFMRKKNIITYDGSAYISEWLAHNSKDISNTHIGHLASVGNDFQNQRMVFIDNETKANWKKGGRHTWISIENLRVVTIYFAVRKAIAANWINDRDQFLYPNDGWKTDTEFQNDCLAYTLFCNNISCRFGLNHWIPFTEAEVDAKDKFDSHFMTDYLAGKMQNTAEQAMLFAETTVAKPLVFSQEARAVFNAARELWRYYHAQDGIEVNAAYYDIREHFQGRNAKGRMNAKSSDLLYTELMDTLRKAMDALARKIEPKIYAYGFLRE